MVRTQIYLSQNQLLHLKKVAYQEEISVSELIRKLIGKVFNEEENKISTKTRKKTAGEILLGLARKAEKLKFGGPKDLARNLDKYLYGRR